MKRLFLTTVILMICVSALAQWQINHVDGDEMRGTAPYDYLCIGDEYSGIGILDNDIVITISGSGIFSSRDGDEIVMGKVGLYDKDPDLGGKMLELHLFFSHRNKAATTISKFTEYHDGSIFATYPNPKKIKKFRNMLYEHLINGGYVRFLIPRFADSDFEIVLPPIELQ